MKVLRLTLPALLLLLPFSMAAAQESDPETGPPGEVPAEEAGELPPPAISRQQAFELVRERFEDVRILSIRQERTRWRVRLDNDGTVMNVFVDTQDGEISLPADDDDESENASPGDTPLEEE